MTGDGVGRHEATRRRRLPTVAEMRKALLAAGAVVAVLAAQGLLSGQVENWTTGIITALSAGLVFLVPNAPPPVP